MSYDGFWRNFQPNNNQVAQGNYNGLIRNVHYLFPQGGVAGSYTTFAALKPNLRSRDIIILGGVLREQAVTPDDVFDVTILGATYNPRQATSGGTPTGGGATWVPPSTGAVAATPLLEIVRAGWNIENIEFTPHTASAGVRLTRSGVTDLIDASHARFSNCLFAANGGTTQIGIEDNGGSSRVVIDECRFEGLTGTAIKGISTAAAVPLGWRISNNRFNNNTNAIAMSLTEGLVLKNYIRQTANDANNKINLIAVAAQGSLNQVIDNIFSDVAANVTIAKGYKPGTTDVWRNYVTDVAAYIVTVPA